MVLAEGFYQSTPRVDADIGPLTLFHPPHYHPNSMVPQNLAGNLQSHVTDFFQQISMATSPEDVMESESLPFASRRRRYPVTQTEQHTPHLPKLARITKLQARNKTPYHTKVMAEGERRRRKTRSGGSSSGESKATEEVRQTPLSGKLSSLTLDLESDKPLYENMDTSIPTQHK